MTRCQTTSLSGTNQVAFYPKVLISSQIKAIQIHHFVPSGHKVLYELLLGILTAIDFSEGSDLWPDMRSTRVPVHLVPMK